METTMTTTTTSKTRTNKNKNRGMEENALAILDSSGIKDSRDVDDDRLAFLEAVRVASVVPETGIAPSRKLYEAIFQIMRNGTSVELTITSYQLLIELDKRFPRVFKSHSELAKMATSSSTSSPESEEVWCPFSLGFERGYSVRNATCGDLGYPLDSSGFSLLTENIAQPVNEIDLQSLGTKLLADMLLFQYLISNLQCDFLRRKTEYKESMDWAILRESLLNMLLQGSRKDKSLIDHCLSIIIKGSRAGFNLHDGESEEKSVGDTVYGCGAALPTLSQLGKETCIAVQILMTMIMELDMMKKEADSQGYLSRADSGRCRTPLLEVIVEFLTYNKDLISPFLQVFSAPKWKLEIILQFFQKYLPKPSVRTRRANNSPDVDTLEGVLRCFSSDTSTHSIVRKINTEVAQTLLAHAFQVYISPLYPVDQNADSNGEDGGSSIPQICKDIISAFQNLRKIDKGLELIPLGKEALFTAAVILSTN